MLQHAQTLTAPGAEQERKLPSPEDSPRTRGGSRPALRSLFRASRPWPALGEQTRTQDLGAFLS